MGRGYSFLRIRIIKFLSAFIRLFFIEEWEPSGIELVVKGFFDRLIKGVELPPEKIKSLEDDVYSSFQKYEDQLVESGTKYMLSDGKLLLSVIKSYR